MGFAFGVSRQHVPSLRTLVLCGILFRAALWCFDPVLEDDHNRYLWDGFRTVTTYDPFSLPPAAAFQEDDLPPEAQDVLDRINHPELRTIYAPGAQYLFAAAHLVSPWSVLPLRVLNLFAELGIALLLYRRFGARATAAFFWCPLWIMESALNVHFEPVAIAMTVAGISAAVNARPALAGVFSALSCAIRPFALLLLPFTTRTLRTVVVFVATLAVLYAPFLLRGLHETHGDFGVGWEFNSSGYALFAMLMPPPAARAACAGIFLAALMTFALRRRDRTAWPPGSAIYGLLLVLSPVANPWYALWLVPFAAARPKAWSWTLLVTISLSYITEGNLTGMGGYAHPWWVRPLEFTPVALAALLPTLARRLGQNRNASVGARSEGNGK